MYDMQRFISMHLGSIGSARFELQRGAKYSHWMWYMFPQLKGLGQSETARYYGMEGIDHARAYMAEPVLREDMLELCGILLAHENLTAYGIFGHPDDMKLRSCMTLFAVAAPEYDVFRRVIDKYFDGEPDHITLRMLGLE